MKNEILRQAEHFSIIDRKNKFIEELAELIRAVSRNDLENVKEEIADTVILLIQYMDKYHIHSNEIITRMEYKLHRTSKQIEDGEI